MTELLTDDQISEALEHLPEWSRDGNKITRVVDFPSFPQAIQAITRIAEIAENEDHHPDMDIRFKKVTFYLTTHFKGGLTANDTSLAQEINGVVDQYLNR
ncbi:4a-hydroxytetrahydrobiopterin dehydratase [Saccharopolyspora griseoalba]|uniref:Putative pterin-4-alpha-carbinolamine dehydratase n=1 Tax=Saccharopolyspora griseoalba TaxID=1431848 RepID=A0ABW2LLS7_9PSEU